MNKPEYCVPLRLRLQRSILRLTIGSVFRVLGRVRMTGIENIPLGTTYIAAINHVSIYDPPFVLALWPEQLEAIGAVDVFDKPGQGQLLKLYGTVPVHRGEYDRVLIDTMLGMLRSGRPMLIAPEGTRSHVLGMQRAKPGVAYIVDEARVPVVPVGIVGTVKHFLRDALHGHRQDLELRVGKPFRLPPLEGRGEQKRLARQRNADLVMQHIAAVLPPEYRGVYAERGINHTP